MKPHHEATVQLQDGQRLFVMGRKADDFPTIEGMMHFTDAKGRIHIIPCANVVRIQIEPTEASEPRRTLRTKVVSKL